MIFVKASLSVLNGTRKLLKLNIFCMFVLLLSVYLSRIKSVIGDILIVERLDMPQFYIFDVFFSLKNEIILITSLLNILDISKLDYGKLMSK